MTTLSEIMASLSPERRRKVEQLAEELIAAERAIRDTRAANRPSPCDNNTESIISLYNVPLWVLP